MPRSLKHRKLVLAVAVVGIIGASAAIYFRSSEEFSPSPASVNKEVATDFSLIPVQIDGKCGYVNRSGQTIIAAQFDGAAPFVEGHSNTAVQFGRQLGIIDRSGNVVTRTPYIWMRNADGLHHFEVENNGEYGIVRRDGGVTEPTLDFLLPFDEHGVAQFREGGKWGFINTLGQIIVPAQFEENAFQASKDWFASDRALVKLRGRYGYIDRNGQLVIQPTFGRAQGFDSAGTAFVSTGAEPEQARWGLIDTSGRWLVEPRFEAAQPFDDAPLAAVRSNGLWGYIDRSGDFKIQPRFLEAGHFTPQGDDWTAVVTVRVPNLVEPQQALIDNAGNIIFGPVSGRLGQIDINGNRVTGPPQSQLLIGSNNQILAGPFEFIRLTTNEHYFFRKDGRSGMLDRNGQIAVQPRYDAVAPGPSDGSLFFVKLGNSWGWVGRDGQFIVSPRFTLCGPFDWQ